MAILVPTWELARAIGADNVRLDAPTVGDLLDLGAQRWGEPFRQAVESATIAVNGRAIALLKARRTKLGADDVVWLLRPAGGG